ncbi:uncharacterized protein C8R40DRAFT_577834 [Lentinula edodes]|uniref:uncharacterized protein n=1 Tax=Lentinula edodes TaxID=5353 RepID=UPI001E8CD2AE|nr:uncharacterized protein C8R40DRAFT_577834 [Lentinula edodes]KAH7879162.1 hypothetical protein C8R40DRAFT_577834 [Lentinula edodes]
MSFETVDITVGNSTETVSINSLWARDDNPGWRALIEAYFGQRSTLNSLKAREQPVLEIPIAEEFDLPQKILIRSELQTMYKRVGALYETKLRAGAIISGQPGCGKSTSIVYFLVEQLADKRPVYVMDKSDQVYFITNMGTWVSSAGVLHTHLGFPMRRLWVLIDSKSSKVEPKRLVLNAGFAVCVPSPALERYKDWMVQHGIPVYFLNPWVPSDLRKCLPLIFDSIFTRVQPHIQEVEEQEEIFLDALYYCVPTPRALRMYFEPLMLEDQHSESDQDSEQTPLVMQLLESGQTALGTEQTPLNSQGPLNPAKNKYVLALVDAINRLNSLRELAKILEIRVEAGYASEISHQLLCIYRSEPHGSPSNRLVKITSDTAYMDFASPWVGEELLRRHSEGQLSDLCRFYHKMSETSDLGVAAGVIFERLFVKRIITPSLTNLRFGLYSALNTPPRRQTRKRAKTPHTRFIGFALVRPSSKSALRWSNSEADEVNKLDPPDADDTKEGDGATDDPNTLFIPQPRWNDAFSLNQYHMIQEVEPVLCTLHVPSKRNNPLFDALLLQEDSPSCVTLWVIQITAAKMHGEASAGYNDIQVIYNRSVEKYGDGNVRVGYMLLVPPKYHQVEWTFEDIHLLPENLRPSNGNVFIQVFQVDELETSVSYDGSSPF